MTIDGTQMCLLCQSSCAIFPILLINSSLFLFICILLSFYFRFLYRQIAAAPATAHMPYPLPIIIRKIIPPVTANAIFPVFYTGNTGAGRMKTIRTANGIITSYEYDEDGNISRLTIGNGTEEGLLYDAFMLYDLCGNRLLREQYSGSFVDVTEGYRYNERNKLAQEFNRYYETKL